MKTRLFIFLFLVFSMVSFAQTNANTDNMQIKKSLTYFINSIKAKKFDQAVTCVYPKYFTTVSREQMKQILEIAYSNPFMKVDIQNLKFGNIEKPEQINGEYFSITDYSAQLTCDLSSMNEAMKKKIRNALISKYGQNNVKYIAKNSYFVIAHMKACAVSKDRKYWKFVILEKQYKPQLKNVLPQKILNKF